MITIEMITAAIYSLIGLAGLIVVLTQILKDAFANVSWYKKAKEAGKKWQDHLLSFITSVVCVGAVIAIGVFFNVGIFAGFCVSCLMSWLMAIGIVIGCTGCANGAWSYEFMQKILEWIKLLPMPTTKKNKQETKNNEN